MLSLAVRLILHRYVDSIYVFIFLTNDDDLNNK